MEEGAFSKFSAFGHTILPEEENLVLGRSQPSSWSIIQLKKPIRESCTYARCSLIQQRSHIINQISTGNIVVVAVDGMTCRSYWCCDRNAFCC